LIQAGHSCAFDGAYVDQHVNTTVVGLDETIALRDVEPPVDTPGMDSLAGGRRNADLGGP